jgi:Na+/phosphate symporter
VTRAIHRDHTALLIAMQFHPASATVGIAASLSTKALGSPRILVCVRGGDNVASLISIAVDDLIRRVLNGWALFGEALVRVVGRGRCGSVWGVGGPPRPIVVSVSRR